MSSPHYDPNFARRMREAAAAVGDRPEMAATLAGSDLTDADINLVGGFTQSLDDAQLVRLARQSGARTQLDPEQRSRLDAIAERYADVDDSGDDDPRNWLERVFDKGSEWLANTGSFLADLPGVEQLFDAFDWLNDVAHLPARLISSGLDFENDDEVDSAMRAKGYDPSNPLSYIAFMTNQGDSLYHDLDGARETYGDRLVDLAIEQQADPEEFAKRLAERDEETQRLAMSDEFAEAADAVDRLHISPGRDIARALTFGHTDNAVFTTISGFFDGAYTLLLDPTLMAGKVRTGVRALDAAGNPIRQASRLDRATGVAALTRAVGRTSWGAQFRSGLRDAVDQDGIRMLLAVGEDGLPTTQVGRGVQRFLDQVDEFDKAKDATDKAAIFARLQAEHRDLMPLFDEVRGRRVLPPANQIHWRTGAEYADELDLYNARVADLAAEPGVREALRPERWKPVRPGLHRSDAGGELEKTKAGWELRSNGEPVQTFRTLAEAKASRTAARADAEYATPTPPALPARDVVDEPFDIKVKDVNGVGWMATDGEAIRTLEDFADYFASTAGMLRMAGGAAAKRELLLPGRVALRHRYVTGPWAAARQTGRGARRNAEIYDHSNPYRVLPHEADEAFQTKLDDVERALAAGEIDAAEAAHRGDLIFQEMRGKWYSLRRQRAKFEQRARRVSSLLPTVQALDLTSADSIEQVRRFARLYMNKTEADRLTAIYAAGDLGRRRSVANAIIEQTLHASGLSRSEAGLKYIEDFRIDQANVAKRAYGLSGTDVIKTEAGDRHVALLPSQLSERVLLPDFRSLQYLATKHAVGGRLTRMGAMRSYLTSEGADSLMAPIKQGWITSPAGGTRNALDEIAGLVLRGQGTDLVRGRRAYAKAKANGRPTQAAARLQLRDLGSIPRALRGLPRTVNDVLVARVLGKVMSYTKTELDDQTIKYAEELIEDERMLVLDKTVMGSYHGDDLLRANDEALQLHQRGIAAAPVYHNGEKVKHELIGWKQTELDGGHGLDQFTDMLGMAFQDMTSPAHVALRAIVNSGDPIGDVVAYMQTPGMRHFLANAEAFKFTRSGRAVQSADDQIEAIEAYAERLSAHVTMLVTGRGELVQQADEAAGVAAKWQNDITKPEWWKDPDHEVGPINQNLAEMLLRGDIPDRVWLKENLADDELPSHVIGKVFAPINPQHLPGRIAEGYTSMLAKAYDLVVTRQVRALSRKPMLHAAYVQARRNSEGYEAALKAAGFTDEAAEAVVRRSARRQAEELVLKSVDNPQQSTQYAMLARNFHAFARAQEDWLRRWGRSIRDNPEQLQRAQLYLHGAEHAGLVERDSEGRMIFTYPGSGAIITLLGKLTSLFPGLPDMANLPMVPDLTSQLIFVNPSLDNPIGFSATPLVSIPFDAIMAMTGADHSLLKSSMDRAINGELGAGREWYEKLLPGAANRIISGVLSDEDPASQYASAWTSALVNLEAAGRTPPADASPTEIARFQNELSAQISNQMVMRAVMGFFAPAAPSVPTNDVVDAETGENILQPDYVWEKAGLDSLKEEARAIFGTMPYDEALAFWAEHHPGELVYQVGTTPRTVVGDSEAQAPATVAAAKWLQENEYLTGKYGGPGGIATYFMPQGSGDAGEFSMDAYRAQLETGIREYKTLDQFFEDIVIQRGEAQYFDTKDEYDRAITEATARGNLFEARRLEDEWSQVKTIIKATNPLMTAKFAAYATTGVARERTVGQLYELLEDPQAVRAIGPQAGGVAELLAAQQDYQAVRDSVKGERGYYATSRREEAKSEFERRIADVVDRFPGLGDLVRGAFRVPD